MENWKTTHLACAALFAILAFIFGILIGYFSREAVLKDPNSLIRQLSREADISLTDKLLESIDTEYLEEVNRYLSAEPALAGTPRQRRLAEYIHSQWTQQGLNSEIVSYDVLLSYPKKNHTNTVSVLGPNGKILYRSAGSERQLHEDEAGTADIVPPFNAYSPSGLVEAELVYVNYGRREDFRRLKAAGINVTGKIVMAKYSKIFRGNKVLLAEEAGAAGVILYTDPSDYTGVLHGDTRVFPDTWWMPGAGVQRGNIVLVKGDQSTPGYPSTEHAYRLPEEELKKILPSIPCQPIGYEDAYHILSHMTGPVAWQDWHGGFNLTYRLSSAADTTPDSNRTSVRLDVANENVYRQIHNVIGVIEGDIEPDRVVLVGNHRDAWVYGGLDPHSGTNAFMEMTRILAKLVEGGWRPRRSLMVCSWDAEEFGLVGSYEWVEGNIKWLQNRAVAYINSDTAVAGNYSMRMKAVPMLRSAVYQAAKRVPSPDGGESLYDMWRERSGSDPPRINPIGSGSDHTPFVSNVGIPAIFPKFVGIAAEPWRSFSNPPYHSRYDSRHVLRLIDPDWNVTRSMIGFTSEFVRDLLDARILPLDVRAYAKHIRSSVMSLITKFNQSLIRNSVNLDGMVSAMTNLTDAADTFSDRLSQVQLENPLSVRRYNDILMNFEKVFIDPDGLPERRRYKHLLHSPSGENHYGGTGFPGLEDLLYTAIERPAPGVWEEVKRNVATLSFVIQAAAEFLL